MGLKRKASFEDSSMSSTSPQSLPPSSQSSATDSSVDRPLNFWNIAGAPYFNSRTRKRFRDDRPDEETIHQNTLNKLFNAQKQHKGGVTPEMNRSIHGLNAQQFHNPHEPILGPFNQVEISRDTSQRSLDGFFNTARDRRNESSSAEQTMQMQEPLPSSLQQPQDTVPHLSPPHPVTMPSILTCEDCDEPLLTENSCEAVDAEMLDVDGSAFVDAEVAEGWSCSVCAKRVCDICAVRGNHRVCLECAVPGGIKYKPEEIQEKRWVGGIGWM